MIRISKQNKWAEFKKRRVIVIDKYIKARKLQAKMELLLKVLFLKQTLNFLSERYKEAINKYELKIKA